MTTSEEKRGVIERYLAAHSAGDVDTVVSLFSADGVAYDPVDQPPHVGTAALQAFFAGTHEMADKLTLTSTGPVRCVGDWAAFPMLVQTEIGDMRLELDVIDVMSFNEAGQISEMRAYWDMADARTTDL